MLFQQNLSNQNYVSHSIIIQENISKFKMVLEPIKKVNNLFTLTVHSSKNQFYKINRSHLLPTSNNHICIFVNLLQHKMNHKHKKHSQKQTNLEVKSTKSFFERFCRALCPCTAHSPDITQAPRSSITTIQKQSTHFASDIIFTHCPINNFREMELILIGDCRSKMLAKISSYRLMPSKESTQKAKLTVKIQKQSPSFDNSDVENLWRNRYMLFQKFDKGIKIDRSSWINTLPQVVAEYISTRTKCITILDALSGIGSAAIKFANKCHSVIVSDPSQQKLQCLYNNVCVYGADNIMKSSKQFLLLQNIYPEPQVIYLHPPLKSSEDYQVEQLNPLQYFQKPSLQQLLQKAFSISNNVVMILPGNVSIEALGIMYSNALMKKRQNCSVSCSIQIQKIYFNRKLKYIAIYYGPIVNRQITIKQELGFVYKLLNDGKFTPFKYKNTVKHIRSKYGMMKLLAFTSQCLKYEGQTIIQKLFEMIRLNQLLPQKLLSNLMKQNTEINLKYLPTLQEQKCDYIQNDSEQYDQSSVTNSFVTNNGDDERFSKVTKEVRGTIMVNGKVTLKIPMQSSSMEKTSLQKTMLYLN